MTARDDYIHDKIRYSRVYRERVGRGLVNPANFVWDLDRFNEDADLQKLSKEIGISIDELRRFGKENRVLLP